MYQGINSFLILSTIVLQIANRERDIACWRLHSSKVQAYMSVVLVWMSDLTYGTMVYSYTGICSVQKCTLRIAHLIFDESELS